MIEKRVTGKSLESKLSNSTTQVTFVSRCIYSCTPTARKVLTYCMLMLIKQMQEKNKKNKGLISFSILEFLRLLGMTKSGALYQKVKDSIFECQNVKMIINDYKAINWFSSVEYDKDNNVIAMKFTPEFCNVIQDWEKSGYSYINLKTIGALKSLHAMMWYELALNYYSIKNKKRNWHFDLSLEELRRLFELDEGAYPRTNNLIDRVIKKPLLELNSENCDFKTDYEKIMHLHRTVGFRIFCKMKAKQSEVKADESQTVKREKKEINDELSMANKLKQEHLDEYVLIFAGEYAKGESWMTDASKKTAAEVSAIKKLIEKYS